MTADELEGRRSLALVSWTAALFAVGAGLCLASYFLFPLSFAQDLSVVQPLDGTDLLLVGDPAATGSRTITTFEYFFPEYLAGLAPFLGGIGLATIVANVFRIAGFDPIRNRRGTIDRESRPRTTRRGPVDTKEL